MATVTGSLGTIYSTRLPAGSNPELLLTPAAPTGTFSGRIIATEPQTITPDPSDGTFSEDIIPNDQLVVPVPYKLQLRWLRPNGYTPGQGYTVVDFPNWDIWVPNGGGRLVDMINATSASSIIWFESTAEPTNPAANTYWYNPSTGDVQKWG